MRCVKCFVELIELRDIDLFLHPKNNCDIQEGISIVVDEVKAKLFIELHGVPSAPKVENFPIRLRKSYIDELVDYVRGNLEKVKVFFWRLK